VALQTIYRGAESGINLYLLFIVMDIIMIVRNPYDPDRYLAWYHRITWTIMAITGSFAGLDVHLEDEWITDYVEVEATVIDGICCFGALVTWHMLRNRCSFGIDLSERARKRVTELQTVFIWGMIPADLFALMVYWIYWQDALDEDGMAVLWCIMSARGIWDFIIWSIAMKRHRSFFIDGDENHQKDLDIRQQLRIELLLFTAKGIYTCASDADGWLHAVKVKDHKRHTENVQKDRQQVGGNLQRIATAGAKQINIVIKPSHVNTTKNPINVTATANYVSPTTGGSHTFNGSNDESSSSIALSEATSNFEADLSSVSRQSTTGGYHPDIKYKNKDIDFYGYKDREFKKIRKYLGIDEEKYIESFRKVDEIVDHHDGAKLNKFFKEIVSSGASGSFFYFTPDLKYMVKTVSKGEKDTLLAVVTPFLKHLQKGAAVNRSSLIHYYGCHSVRLPLNSGKVYFVVMRNFLYDEDFPIEKPQITADLKGATSNRRRLRAAEALQKAKASWSDHGKVKGTLLDMDWTDMKLEIDISAEKKRQLMEVISYDLDFLAEVGCMDYSLLVGMRAPSDEEMRGIELIHMLTENNENNTSEANSEKDRSEASNSVKDYVINLDDGGDGYSMRDSIASIPTNVLSKENDLAVLTGTNGVRYFVGVIDILERWSGGWARQGCLLQFIFKYLCCGKFYNPRGITAIAPEEYALRCEEYLAAEILRSEELLENPAGPGEAGRLTSHRQWRPFREHD